MYSKITKIFNRNYNLFNRLFRAVDTPPNIGDVSTARIKEIKKWKICLPARRCNTNGKRYVIRKKLVLWINLFFHWALLSVENWAYRSNKGLSARKRVEILSTFQIKAKFFFFKKTLNKKYCDSQLNKAHLFCYINFLPW